MLHQDLLIRSPLGLEKVKIKSKCIHRVREANKETFCGNHKQIEKIFDAHLQITEAEMSGWSVLRKVEFATGSGRVIHRTYSAGHEGNSRKAGLQSPPNASLTIVWDHVATSRFLITLRE